MLINAIAQLTALGLVTLAAGAPSHKNRNCGRGDRLCPIGYECVPKRPSCTDLSRCRGRCELAPEPLPVFPPLTTRVPFPSQILSLLPLLTLPTPPFTPEPVPEPIETVLPEPFELSEDDLLSLTQRPSPTRKPTPLTPTPFLPFPFPEDPIPIIGPFPTFDPIIDTTPIPFPGKPTPVVDPFPFPIPELRSTTEPFPQLPEEPTAIVDPFPIFSEDPTAIIDEPFSISDILLPTSLGTPENEYRSCGGFRINPPRCPRGTYCSDDPRDPSSCGMACDAPGICIPKDAPVCGGFAGLECPDGLGCYEDPNDDCDPEEGWSDCFGICL